MSVQALSGAFALRGVSPTEKLVALALANYADPHGRCWPSHSCMAADTGLSERTILTALKGLEAYGLLSRQERRRTDGSRSSDLITLSFGGGEMVSPRGEALSPGGGETVAGGGEMVSPLTTFEPPINRKITLQGVREAAGDALASMATHPNIASIAPLLVLMAGEKPCDPEQDVYPAIVAAAAWHRSRDGPGSMTSWTTAAKIAVQNRDRRLAGNPEPKAPHERPDTPSAKRAAREGNLSRGFAASHAVSRSDRVFT